MSRTKGVISLMAAATVVTVATYVIKKAYNWYQHLQDGIVTPIAQHNHLQIWQLPHQAPGKWYGVRILYNIPENNSRNSKPGWVFAGFEDGMDFVMNHDERINEDEVRGYMNSFKRQGFHRLDTNLYAKSYGLEQNLTSICTA